MAIVCDSEYIHRHSVKNKNTKDSRIVGITIKLKVNLIAWGFDMGFDEDNKSYIHIGCFRLYVYPIYD